MATQGWAEGRAGERRPPAQHHTDRLWLVSLSLWRQAAAGRRRPQEQAAAAAAGGGSGGRRRQRRQAAAAAVGTSLLGSAAGVPGPCRDCHSRAVAVLPKEESCRELRPGVGRPQVWNEAPLAPEAQSPTTSLVWGRAPAAEKQTASFEPPRDSFAADHAAGGHWETLRREAGSDSDAQTAAAPAAAICSSAAAAAVQRESALARDSVRDPVYRCCAYHLRSWLVFESGQPKHTQDELRQLKSGRWTQAHGQGGGIDKRSVREQLFRLASSSEQKFLMVRTTLRRLCMGMQAESPYLGGRP